MPFWVFARRETYFNIKNVDITEIVRNFESSKGNKPSGNRKIKNFITS